MASYLTSELPGSGGHIRNKTEDFFVEEIPLYNPCGTGEHLYLTIEKRDLTTFDLLKRVARKLGCLEREIGYAGLKDARAVTRQTISVPRRKAETLARLELPGVKLIAATPHTNKLRQGHLAGNRFRIRIRNPHADGLRRSQAILSVLNERGVPNKFGDQRYGVLGNSDRIGKALLAEDFSAALQDIIGDPSKIVHPDWQISAESFRVNDLDTALTHLPQHCQNERVVLEKLKRGASPKSAVLSLPRKLLRLYLSAYQSRLFDCLVDMRLTSIGQLWPGDLAYKHINGACFLVSDPACEQPRADCFEISPSGPLFGYKVKLAEGQAGHLEKKILNSENLTLKTFHLIKGLSMEGGRRPLRAPLANAIVTADSQSLTLSFTLPKGSFATAVLAEVMKTR